ncbi:hypothetical protein P3T43_003358 [Paraburkholderia sp. GAS41]
MGRVSGNRRGAGWTLGDQFLNLGCLVPPTGMLVPVLLLRPVVVRSPEAQAYQGLQPWSRSEGLRTHIGPLVQSGVARWYTGQRPTLPASY